MCHIDCSGDGSSNSGGGSDDGVAVVQEVMTLEVVTMAEAIQGVVTLIGACMDSVRQRRLLLNVCAA